MRVTPAFRPTRDEARRLLDLLNAELSGAGVRGEVYLVGEAVVCLALPLHPPQRDVAGHFEPTARILEAANRVAREEGLGRGWLRVAVNAFLGGLGIRCRFLSLSHLTVSTASPEFLLVMTCLALGSGGPRADTGDVLFLLRYLAIESYDDAITAIARYFPEDRIPEYALSALKQLTCGAIGGPRSADEHTPTEE